MLDENKKKSKVYERLICNLSHNLILQFHELK
uniref:Uncharacterized protein n=1 Tax=Anguilla anguilla TaxID=7936 RepID=A0A0E9RML1_ANGAN